MPKAIDLTGQKFNRLTAICRTDSSCSDYNVWLFVCDCGKERTAPARKVKDGTVKSCGCFKRDVDIQRMVARNTKHGMRRLPEYSIWLGVKKRCLNPASSHYSDYGGRGITMVAEWANDFTAFLAYMGPRPSKRHTVERIDNNRGYEPGNVRWATYAEQMRNTRRTRIYTIDGYTGCLTDIAKRYGLTFSCLYSRLQKNPDIHQAIHGTRNDLS